MRRFPAFALIAALGLAAVPVLPAVASAGVVFLAPPIPVPRVEVVAPYPVGYAPGYVWVPGYWSWGGPRGYYWVGGAWFRPPFHGARWVSPGWGHGPGGHRWVSGHWAHSAHGAWQGGGHWGGQRGHR